MGLDAARQVLGIVLVVCMPPAIAFWLVIHPVARWWRRLDVRLTYTLLAALVTGLGVLLYACRAALLGRDLGTNGPLIGIGVALYLASIAVSLLCRRQLGLKTFAGLPELSRAAYPGRLLQEGVYGVIRHPRYLSVILGTVGCALFVNHLGTYLVVAVTLLGLWPLIVVEERELASRFGAAYIAYRARTPALMPRFGRK